MPDSTNPVPEPTSRRQFLGRVAALGAGASAFLAACGGDDAAPAAGGDAAPAPATANISASECAGYDALTPEELQTRQALGYVDNSPNPSQLCSNCRFYVQPEGGSPCGGCTLFPGPVAPDGYCNSWAAQAA